MQSKFVPNRPNREEKVGTAPTRRMHCINRKWGEQGRRREKINVPKELRYKTGNSQTHSQLGSSQGMLVLVSPLDTSSSSSLSTGFFDANRSKMTMNPHLGLGPVSANSGSGSGFKTGPAAKIASRLCPAPQYFPLAYDTYNCCEPVLWLPVHKQITRSLP